jgi:hypothetical protein
MRISSFFPAVLTAITAAGFALTEPVPQTIALSGDVDLGRVSAPALTAMMLAAFDPLSLAPRVTDAAVH